MWREYGGDKVKLNKNLILISILTVSIFVSSTSYASSKDNVRIKVNQAALNEMASKVDRNTIFAEVDTELPKNEKNDRTEGNKKPIDKNPNNDPKTENPVSTENPNDTVKPETDKDKIPNESEVEDKSDIPKDTIDDIEDKKDTNEVIKDNGSNKNPVDKNEGPKKQNLPSDQKDSNQAIVDEKNDFGSPNFETMQRLENIHKDEKSKDKSYSETVNSNIVTMQKLTSKETLTTSFKDKGSNLRLNLANVNDDGKTTEKEVSKSVIRPQTIIILIAILSAIFSAFFIAISGKKTKNTDFN